MLNFLNNATLNLGAGKSITTEDTRTTLGLNGKTHTIKKIDSKNSNRIIVIVYVKVDDSASGKYPIRVRSMDAMASAKGSSLTHNDVNITSVDYSIAVFSKGNLTVNEGSSITAVSSAIVTNGSSTIRNGNSCDVEITLKG